MVRKGFAPKIQPRRPAQGPPTPAPSATPSQPDKPTATSATAAHAERQKASAAAHPALPPSRIASGGTTTTVSASATTAAAATAEGRGGKRRRVDDDDNDDDDEEIDETDSAPHHTRPTRATSGNAGALATGAKGRAVTEAAPAQLPPLLERGGVIVPVTTSQDVANSDAAGTGMELSVIDPRGLDARRRSRKRQDRPPEDQMRVKDHIYFNPPKPKSDGKKRAAGMMPSSPAANAAASVTSPPPPTPSPSVTPAPAPSAGPAIAAPQVVLDKVTGKFVVDPTSLEARSAMLDHESVGELVQQRSAASYSAYSKRTASKRWTPEETATFFRGIRTFGIDFDMIKRFFLPNRDHTQLKNKYNREDKVDRSKIDFCLDPKNRLDPPADPEAGEPT